MPSLQSVAQHLFQKDMESYRKWQVTTAGLNTVNAIGCGPILVKQQKHSATSWEPQGGNWGGEGGGVGGVSYQVAPSYGWREITTMGSSSDGLL